MLNYLRHQIPCLLVTHEKMLDGYDQKISQKEKQAPYTVAI